jgi:hypothetical protein
VGFRLLGANRMEGGQSDQLRGAPVFMRLRRTLPMVTMRLQGGESQSKNTCFPQFSSVFSGNRRFLPVFLHLGR